MPRTRGVVTSGVCGCPACSEAMYQTLCFTGKLWVRRGAGWVLDRHRDACEPARHTPGQCPGTEEATPQRSAWLMCPCPGTLATLALLAPPTTVLKGLVRHPDMRNNRPLSGLKAIWGCKGLARVPYRMLSRCLELHGAANKPEIKPTFQVPTLPCLRIVPDASCIASHRMVCRTNRSAYGT